MEPAKIDFAVCEVNRRDVYAGQNLAWARDGDGDIFHAHVFCTMQDGRPHHAISLGPRRQSHGWKITLVALPLF
jgi:hypothetical protein